MSDRAIFCYEKGQGNQRVDGACMIDRSRKKKHYNNAGGANDAGQPARKKGVKPTSQSGGIFKAIARFFGFR